jgi:hypothetical protein
VAGIGRLLKGQQRAVVVTLLDQQGGLELQGDGTVVRIVSVDRLFGMFGCCCGVVCLCGEKGPAERFRGGILQRAGVPANSASAAAASATRLSRQPVMPVSSRTP